MKSTALVLATLLSVAGFAAHAESPDPAGQFAQGSHLAKTRAEVRAELREAQRTGNLLAAGDSGQTLAQLNPAAYGVQPVVAAKTREQVRQETLQAIRNGDVIVGGDAGLTQRQLFPQEYPAFAAQPRQAFASRNAATLPR